MQNCRGSLVGILVVMSTLLSGCGRTLTEIGLLPGDSPSSVVSPVEEKWPGSPWTRYTLGGGGGQPGIAIDPTNPDVVYVTTDNGGIVKSTDGGETWFPIINNIGNRRLGDIALDPLDPQVVYVVAEVYARRPRWSDDPVNGELYRSLDGGQHWEVVYAEGMGSGDGRSFGIVRWPSTRNILLPHDPSDPDRYDADGDGLTDVIYIGGWDWDEASPDSRAGLWKSTDEGRTFSQIALEDKKVWVLRQDPDDPETLYVGTYGDGLFVSRDGGITWEDWSQRLPLPMISDIAIVPHSQVLYVATNTFYSRYNADEYRGKRGLYKSTDGGMTFFPINTGLEGTSLNFEVLALDPTDPSGQTLYTGPWKGPDQAIYRTTDGGATWSPMAYETVEEPFWFQRFSNLWAMDVTGDGTFFATTWRGIYRYDPSQERWALKVKGLGNISVRTIAFEPGSDSTIYLGILDSTPWKSTDGGRTWQNIGEGFVTADGAKQASASDFAISPTHPQIIYATGVGPSGRYLSAVNKSEDGGHRWKRIVNGLPPTSAEDPQWQANAIVVSAYDPDVAYVALELKSGGGRIYKTTDGGRRWREVYTLSERPTALAISATSPETVVCGTDQGTVCIGEQGGKRWRSSRPGSHRIYDVALFPTDPNRILVGMNVAGAYLTTDGGRSWQHVFDEDDLLPLTEGIALSDFARGRYRPTIRAVQFDPRDPDTLYLGHNPGRWMGVGILKSTDGGRTWIALADEGFQMRSVNDFDLDATSGNLVVGSWEVYYYDAKAKDDQQQTR